MIVAPLVRFLRDPNQVFSAGSATRNTNLAEFRNYIGSNVFIGRVPDGVEPSDYTCVIQQTGMDREYGTTSERTSVLEYVQVDIYGSDFEASTKTIEIFESLRLALSSYYGKLMDTQVQHVRISRESQTVNQEHAGDGWSFRYSADFEFYYQQASAVASL